MNDFLRSQRALEADDPRGSLLGLSVAAIVLVAWALWFLFARLTLYEVTDRARIEVGRAVHPLEAAASGRVVESRLALDREVKAGEVLVELDTRGREFELDAERARIAAIDQQIPALEAEIQAKQRSLEASDQGTRAALQQARDDLLEAETMAKLAEQEAERAAKLEASGVLSKADLERAEAEAKRRRAAASSREMAVSRLEREERARSGDRAAELQRLRREMDSLRGERQTLLAQVQRLEFESDRLRIRAPVDGRLGEVADLQVGQVIEAGEKIGAVVPRGDLHVVAHFPPASALGRIRPGQQGRVRLEGFPWTQYGTVPIEVVSVASEVRDGGVRVELAVKRDAASRIPLEHGLPGTVEIEVGRVSPAALALRAAGKLLASPGPPPATTSSAAH